MGDDINKLIEALTEASVISVEQAHKALLSELGDVQEACIRAGAALIVLDPTRAEKILPGSRVWQRPLEEALELIRMEASQAAFGGRLSELQGLQELAKALHRRGEREKTDG